MPTMEEIKRSVEAMPIGRPFATGAFLPFGNRAAVDKALSRLSSTGVIVRVARGIYVRPRMSPYLGAVRPDPEEVAKAAAEAMGASIAPHGAAWALGMGLTQQVALRPTYLTDGSTRHLRMGKLTIVLEHASPKHMRLAGSPVGGAVLALEWLGQATPLSPSLARIREALGEPTFFQFLEQAKAYGGWIAKSARTFESLENRP